MITQFTALVNPGPDIRSSRMAQCYTLYHPARYDLWVRICNWMVNSTI